MLAYYTTNGLSNAKTEAVNALMKKVQRIGLGFPEPAQLPAAAAAAQRRRRRQDQPAAKTTDRHEHDDVGR